MSIILLTVRTWIEYKSCVIVYLLNTGLTHPFITHSTLSILYVLLEAYLAFFVLNWSVGTIKVVIDMVAIEFFLWIHWRFRVFKFVFISMSYSIILSILIRLHFILFFWYRLLCVHSCSLFLDILTFPTPLFIFLFDRFKPFDI